MLTGLIGKKITQTRIYTDEGRQIPVTHIKLGPCTIVQVRTIEKDGYSAVQIGFGDMREKSLNKPEKGHLTKTGKAEKDFPRFLREVDFTLKSDEEAPVSGTEIAIDSIFTIGDIVKVTGVSKGKGFAGGVRRYGFAGGPKTHGQSDRHRAPGSIGSGTTPGRVYKGKRMAGRMGGETVTIRGLKVVAVDTATQIVTVKGVVPGNKNGLVVVQKQ